MKNTISKFFKSFFQGLYFSIKFSFHCLLYFSIMFCIIFQYKLNNQQLLLIQEMKRLNYMVRTINNFENNLLLKTKYNNSNDINHINNFKNLNKKDVIYYNFITFHNSYSNPLSEKEIFKIIKTLKKCKNDPKLLLSIAEVESSFNKEAVSKYGCIGLMQINPIHAKKYNFKPSDLFDPCKSLLIADKLISDWKSKNPQINIQGICRKYLGCHSKIYVKKIVTNINKFKNPTFCNI